MLYDNYLLEDRSFSCWFTKWRKSMIPKIRSDFLDREVWINLDDPRRLISLFRKRTKINYFVFQVSSSLYPYVILYFSIFSCDRYSWWKWNIMIKEEKLKKKREKEDCKRKQKKWKEEIVMKKNHDKKIMQKYHKIFI